MAVTFFFLPTIHICQHTFCVAHHRRCLRLSGLSDMDYDILDLDNVPPFNDKQWIKAGKQYPKNNTPYEVLWARNDIQNIPEFHLKHLPEQNLHFWHQMLSYVCWPPYQRLYLPDLSLLKRKLNDLCSCCREKINSGMQQIFSINVDIIWMRIQVDEYSILFLRV